MVNLRFSILLFLSSVSYADVCLIGLGIAIARIKLYTEKLFGRFPELLDIKNNSTLLSTFIWHIRHRGLSFAPGWYAPTSEKGIIISSFLIILYILDLILSKQGQEYILKIIKKSRPLGLGLEFDLSGNSRGKGLLLLAHRESLFQSGEQIAVEEQIFNELVRYRIMVQAVINDNCRPVKYEFD